MGLRVIGASQSSHGTTIINRGILRDAPVRVFFERTDMRRREIIGRVNPAARRGNGSPGSVWGLDPGEMIFNTREPTSHSHGIPAKRIGCGRSLAECLDLASQVINLGLEVAIQRFLMKEHGAKKPAHQATGKTKHALRSLRIVDTRVVKGEVSHEESGLPDQDQRMLGNAQDSPTFRRRTCQIQAASATSDSARPSASRARRTASAGVPGEDSDLVLAESSSNCTRRGARPST